MTPSPNEGAKAPDTPSYVQNFARLHGIKPCEAIARLSGFKCYEQMRQARFVTERGTPELIDAMDREVAAIHNAYFLAKCPADIQREMLATGRKGMDDD